MDNVFLTGPLGTQWNIGSWIDKTQPLDYGAAGVMRQQLTQTTFVEGAQLGYETAAGARKMTFPIRVPSGGVAGLSLDVLESSIREMVRPGGHVDLQPQGVATAEMVRFDIIGGDVAHTQYSVDLQRINRRELTVTLQTQPFGYWPTAIVLASVASIGAGPFSLTIPKASIIGDIPGFGILQIAPFHASNFGGLSTWGADMIAWSVGGKPSFNPFLHPASWLSAATLGADANAPASQYAGYYLNPADPWNMGAGPNAFYAIPTTVAPAYQGRFRFFAFLKLGPSAPGPWQAIADNLPQAIVAAPLATGNPIATVVPIAIPAGFSETWNNVGSGYQIVDMGELTIPRFSPSTQNFGREAIRLQLNLAPSGPTSVPSGGAFLKIGGGYLLPLDSPAGILPRGLTQPNTLAPPAAQKGTLFLNAQTRDNLIFQSADPPGGTPLATGQEVANTGYITYRGQLPLVGATVNQLTGFVGVRALAAGTIEPPAISPNTRTGVSLSYVPRFTFLHGI